MAQIEHDTSQMCPTCESEDIDEEIDSFDGVCRDCGFVIHSGENPISLNWHVADELFREETNGEWLTECRIRNSTEQQLARAFDTIEQFANQLSLSGDLREETVDIYCDAFRNELTDGRNTDCFVAACLRIGSQRVGQPIPTSRLTEFSGVTVTKYNSSYLALCDGLDITSSTSKPSEYVPFIGHCLDLSCSESDEIEKLLTTIDGKQKFVGKDPAGIAAGGVYLLHGHTQQRVAECVGLSAETVRQRVDELQEVVGDV